MSLDPEALHLVRFSAGGLSAHLEDFTRRLHQDIVGLSPGLASRVAGRGWPFCDRMARAVIWVALTEESSPAAAGKLRQIGMDNWRDGFPDAEYVSVAHALIRAIRSLSENDWLTAMNSAWISCFQWMWPHLLAGARQAAAEQPVGRSAGPGR
jgi:hemoglobin-like flavoprotein